MSTRSLRIDKTLLANRFGSRVSTYDAVTPVQAEMAKMLVGQALDHFTSQQPLRILELGCGTGRMTCQLATVFPEAQITALDISADMIRFAKTRNLRVEYVVADAETYLRDTTDTYDLIISNAVMQWFEDADRALANAYKKLAFQGQIIVSTFGDQTFNELNHSFTHAYAITGQPMTTHTVPMRTVEEWRRRLPEAIISQEILSRSFADVRSFLRSVQEAGAVNSMSERHFLSPQVLREMMIYYTSHFSNLATGHIKATYHVIYLKNIKK